VLVQIVELGGKMLKEVNEGFLFDSSLGDLAMIVLIGLVVWSCTAKGMIAT
jgi:hypothetical protein